MNLSNLLIDFCNIKKSDFNHLKDLGFSGVYILCCDDDVVYIGSAYARTIETRLKQYLSPTDTGNSLLRAIYKQETVLAKPTKTTKKELLPKLKDLRYMLLNMRTWNTN